MFKGISGILSAKGTFGGRLERIEVHGETDTPEFTITSVGHAIPLLAKYHAIVDGTNGNTILERIDGSFLNTSLVAKGDVTDLPGAPGRQVNLDVTMDQGAAGGHPVAGGQDAEAADDGSAHAPDHHDSPARRGGRDREAATRRQVHDREDAVHGPGHSKTRSKVSASEAAASCRTQPAAPVTSDFTGSFKLANGVLTIPSVAFDIPGSVVRLAGTYSIKPETMDFKGTLFMDAKISETMTGFKSLLLKVIDPLFSGENGGSEIPIRISGQREKPAFGLDKGRVFKKGD